MTVTYGFRNSAPVDGGVFSTGFSKFTTSQMAAARIALQEWADVANIKFTEVGGGGFTDNATMLFSNYTSASLAATSGIAFGILPKNKETAAASEEGDTFYDLRYSPYTDVTFGTEDFSTYLHEIGHAIGLSHPGDYNAGEGKNAVYSKDAIYNEDSLQYTLMSYFAASETGSTVVFNGVTLQPSTPLLADIAAAQRLYGANTTTRTGDNVYGFNSNAGDQYKLTSTKQAIFTIWDAGGTNTLDVSGYSTNQVINLNQGAFSDIGSLTKNVSIAVGTVIQRAIGGAGNDTIVMNNNGDRVTGGGGNDTLTGGTGLDYALYSGTAASHTVARNGSTITITDTTAGRDGTDSLTNVERAIFSDVTLAFDLNGSGGQGYRLYKAAFNRTPDQDGVSFWINNLDKGMSLRTAAQAFVDSAEYKSIYGTNPSAETIVAAFYGNVLGRRPEQSGLDFWIGVYRGGMSTADLLVNFSESAENQASTVAVVGNGISLTTSLLG